MRARFLFAALVAASCVAPAALPVDPLDAIVDRLKVQEGFSPVAYDDAGGKSQGYGTRLPFMAAEALGLANPDTITETEGDWLLRGRLESTASEFAACWDPVGDQPIEVQSALYDVAYQLGAEGLCRFGTMLGFIAAGRYAEAADDALGTLWAEETPARAQALAEVLRRAGG